MKLILILTLFGLGIFPSYQLPGLAVQNSLSFENAGNNVSGVIANRGLITIYPTGGSTFNVPNTGAISSVEFTPSDVRVVSDSEGTYIGAISYLSPGQINVWATGRLVANPTTVTLTGNITFKIQKKISEVWTDVSSTGTFYFDYVTPHQSVVYQSSAPKGNADLYVWDGSGYIFYKKTLGNASSPLSGYNASDNPRSVSGHASVLAFYGTGAEGPVPYFSLCASHIKIGGTQSDSLLLSGFVASGYNGVQQINMYVPSSVTDSTTFQFSAEALYISGSCGSNPVINGNTFTIPNWR